MQQLSFSTQNPQHIVYLLFAFSFRKLAVLTSGNELVLQCLAGSRQHSTFVPCTTTPGVSGLLTAHFSRAEPLVVSYSKTLYRISWIKGSYILFLNLRAFGLSQIQNLIQFIPPFPCRIPVNLPFCTFQSSSPQSRKRFHNKWNQPLPRDCVAFQSCREVFMFSLSPPVFHVPMCLPGINTMPLLCNVKTRSIGI